MCSLSDITIAAPAVQVAYPLSLQQLHVFQFETLNHLYLE